MLQQATFFYVMVLTFLVVLIYLFFKIFHYLNNKIDRHYFVSYNFYTPNGFKFGNSIFVEKGPIFSFTKAQTDISKQILCVGAVIINDYKKLSKRELKKNNQYGNFT